MDFSTGRFTSARRYYEIAAAHDDGTDANLIAALGIMVTLAEGDLNTALSIAATMSEPTESTQAIGLAAVHTWAGQFEQARRYIAIARELGASEPSDYAIAVAPGFAAVLGIVPDTSNQKLDGSEADEHDGHRGYRHGERVVAQYFRPERPGNQDDEAEFGKLGDEFARPEDCDVAEKAAFDFHAGNCPSAGSVSFMN